MSAEGDSRSVPLPGFLRGIVPREWILDRQEAKEARFWIRLVDTGEQESLELEREWIRAESLELSSILSAILRKAE